MSETGPSGYEVDREHIPSVEEVVSIIKEIIGEKEYTETRRASDDKGLYFLEILIKDPNGNVEYEYKRKGEFPQGSMGWKNFECTINVNFYDKDGEAVSGYNVADFVDGKWKKNY